MPGANAQAITSVAITRFEVDQVMGPVDQGGLSNSCYHQSLRRGKTDTRLVILTTLSLSDRRDNRSNRSSFDPGATRKLYFEASSVVNSC